MVLTGAVWVLLALGDLAVPTHAPHRRSRRIARRSLKPSIPVTGAGIPLRDAHVLEFRIGPRQPQGRL